MMISIGLKHFIESKYIVEILRAEDSRADRIKRAAAESGMLINATDGRRIRSIIKLKSKHIVLSALKAETLTSELGESLHVAVPANSGILKGKYKKNHERESKPSEFDDRRMDSDRRRFDYTYHIPERRSGIERRSKNGKFKRKRKIE
jgi:regulator of extracellular matrix RemA (YlzA/DUF370 family)